MSEAPPRAVVTSGAQIASGVVVAGRYRIERLLGEGGMGAVWSATHMLTHKPVALKFLKGPANPELIRRFVREARAASAVRHPNVVEIHDIITLEDGLPAMVMDLLDGESLAQRLERAGAVPLGELASIMVAVVSAVGTAHAAGIVHRDLKPDNIYLARLGDGRVEPMVLDFGICKLNAADGAAAETSALTRTGSMMGTPYYMAPEQVFGEKDLDARADVWALGIILYECSSGRRPIGGDNFGQVIKMITAGSIPPLNQVAPHLPPEFTHMVARMLTQDRNQRLRDLREVFGTLRQLTEVRAQTFGNATAVLEPQAPTGPYHVNTPRGASGVALAASGVPLAASGAPLAASGAPLAASGAMPPYMTGNPLVTSNVAAPAARSSLPGVVLGAGAMLLLVGAGALFFALRAPSSPAPVEPVAAQNPTPVAAPPPAPPVLAAAPATPEPTPAPAVSASASAKPSATISHPPAAAAPLKPAATQPKKGKDDSGPAPLPGGVHGPVPF